MRNKYLLGATKEGNLAFGEFEIRECHPNGSSDFQQYIFSASFDLVRPFNSEDIDEEYIDNYLDGFDKETLYDMCREYHCAPQNLAEEYLQDHDVMDIVDCSLYPEVIEIHGVDYMFEADGCGQIDLLDQMDKFTNFKAFSLLYMLWRQYHLKTLSGHDLAFIKQQISEIEELFKKEALEEKEWIEDYLEHRNDEED